MVKCKEKLRWDQYYFCTIVFTFIGKNFKKVFFIPPIHRECTGELSAPLLLNDILFCSTLDYWVGPQIYKEGPRTCAILIPAWGSNWGYSGISHNQNNHGSSDGHVTCIYYGLSVKIHTRWNATRRVNGRICFAFAFAYVVSKNSSVPNLSLVWDHPYYICGWDQCFK